MAYRDDLDAAVARAEAAERALAGVCAVHTSTPSTAECAACGRKFCDACVMPSADLAVLCTTCFVAQTTRRRRRNVLVATAAIAVAGGGVGAFLALSPKHSEDAIAKALAPPPASEAAKYNKRPNRIRVLRETLTADPCNRDAALELAELLNENGAYIETIDANKHFLDKCGPYPRLVWTSVYASEQRSDWMPAIALATDLIKDEPTDADFWWWRGQDRAAMGVGSYQQADADYRQSMALGGQRFAAFRFAALAEKTNRPCEGAFAVRYLVTVDRGGEFGDAWDRFKKLYTAGACDDLTGHGKATIKFRPDMPFVSVQLKVGETSGTFVVDSSAGFLTMTRAFAAKAGVKGDHPPKVTTYVMGELREADVASADSVTLDGASATAVDTAIVDDLAPELDGVVGLSFLWRFRVDRDDSKGEIQLTGWN